DRRGGRGDLLDDRVDLAHARVAADQPGAVVRARRNDLHFLLARVEPQLALAHRDDRARLEEGLANADLVDERAVGRSVVDQDIAIVFLGDPAVIARDRVVPEDDVVIVHRSDPDLLLVEYPL